MLLNALFMLAACGGQNTNAPDATVTPPTEAAAAGAAGAANPEVTASFILAYQAMVNGELEPCG